MTERAAGTGGGHVHASSALADAEVTDESRWQQGARNGGVAVVGAREDDLWTYLLFDNLDRFAPERPLWPISQSRPTVRGRRAYPSLAELPELPEVVVIAVSAGRAVAVVGEAAGAGVRHVVAISSGFAERGDEEGRVLERRLAEAVLGTGSRLYGPNGVGFADFAAGLCPLGAPIPPGLRPGNVSVISQSGSLTTSMLGGLVEDGAGLDWCVSIGNGTCFDAVDAIGVALARPTTEVICGYLESFGRGGRRRLETALAEAAARDVPIVLVKGGATSVAAEIARTHTAALSGSDRLVQEVLTRHGVIRVSDLEQLVRTTAIAAYRRRAVGPRPRPDTLAVIETSGGAAVLVADMMAEQGLPLARFSDATLDALQACGPPGSFVSNPIDLTASPKPFEEVTAAFRAVYADPGVGSVLIPFALTFPTIDDGRRVHRVSLDRYAQLAELTGTPTLVSTVTVHGWTDWARRYREEHPAVLVLRGLSATLEALGRLAPPPAAAEQPAGVLSAHAPGVGERVAGAAGSAEAAEAGGPLPPGHLRSLLSPAVPDILEGRRRLEAAGVAMPHAVFVDREEIGGLAAATRALDYPVAVKLVVPGLLHKARVGGVALGCATPGEAALAAARIVAGAGEHGLGGELVRGVLVEEMVHGVELFVALDRDGWYGPYALLAAGGADVERASAGLLPLPIEPQQLRSALVEALSAAGGGETEVVAAAATIELLAASFLDGELACWRTVEINPLVVGRDAAWPVDVVLVAAAAT